MREVTHHYEDALSRVWTTAAERMGFRVVRSDDVYASTDGRGTLIIGTDQTLDADDSLAQMIFHELCHSLIEGPDSLDKEDWGLANQDDRDTLREYACLRLQAALGAPLGLRWFFAPTTDHRAFFDALDEDPLWPHDDPACVLARLGLLRADKAPWGPHLRDALEATARIAETLAPFAREPHASQSLWSSVQPRLPMHASGLPVAIGSRADASCESCAWLSRDARGVMRCLQINRKLSAWDGACERWEAALDCQDCGACCREAYDTVDVSPRDAFVKKHRSLLVERSDGSFGLSRAGGLCIALTYDASRTSRYACRVYDDRPRTCRDFTLGSANCLDARRRVGLSR